jgi:NCAIR mutase (PurE)-related protein
MTGSAHDPGLHGPHSRNSAARAEDLGHSTIDLDREARQGTPEVIYGPGKTLSQIAEIATALLARNTGVVMATRVDAATAADVLGGMPASAEPGAYDAPARLLVWRPASLSAHRVVIVTAGTADGPVAEEAASTCRALGLSATRVNDVGVAGIHRLLARVDEVRAADVVIVIAGMEGALASAVGGLVRSPVIAVPTSTGYGASLEGVTALLAMMASCAAGMVVVNIDNGFGAAMAAKRMLQLTGSRS